MHRCISILLIFSFFSLALPAVAMSCAPEDKECPQRLNRIMAVIGLSRLTILKEQCPVFHPENASAYEAGFGRLDQIFKEKLADITEIQKTQEYRTALENNKKEIAGLSRDKLQVECDFLLKGPEKRDGMGPR